MSRGHEALLVLIAIAAVGCDEPDSESPAYGSGYGDCEPEAAKEQMMTIELPAEPPVELRIESCRRDVDACLQLCVFVLDQAGKDPYIDRCRVELFADAVHVLYVPYQNQYSQGWCP